MATKKDMYLISHHTISKLADVLHIMEKMLEQWDAELTIDTNDSSLEPEKVEGYLYDTKTQLTNEIHFNNLIHDIKRKYKPESKLD